MYSVRKIKTKSGSVAVQVVRYVGHRSIVAKHIGSAKDQLNILLFRINNKYRSIFKLPRVQQMVSDRTLSEEYLLRDRWQTFQNHP